ncbi:hypothetical protein HPB52_005215 [Rhipicephalus sanguineus]|uniref:CCHC-type domain-containing protein n=1 Tax=Rhipicephalus sanguineus TaxID=34632 RepID=A0A9D4PKW1_RHISA|nr:hypothetical protein HPB52_005215 [Rhipicephalus sanguineus]
MEYVVEGQEVSPEELSHGSWQSPGLRAQEQRRAALRRAAAANTTPTTIRPVLRHLGHAVARRFLASRLTPFTSSAVVNLPSTIISFSHSTYTLPCCKQRICKIPRPHPVTRLPPHHIPHDVRHYLHLHLYAPSPDDALRGILYHAFDDFTSEDLQASNPTLSIVGGRCMGKTPNILVALTEPNVPAWILYHGVHLRLLPLHNKAEACFNCRLTGHCTDVCPKPRQGRCHRCGATHPPPPEGSPPTCTPR